MRLVVFGATGHTGPFVLREALARQHNVTAFARPPEALSDIAGLALSSTGTPAMRPRPAKRSADRTRSRRNPVSRAPGEPPQRCPA
jgi:uncharacterized protein YbjT (DUF2867 family)